MNKNTIDKIKDRKIYLKSLDKIYNSNPSLAVIVTSFNHKDNIPPLVKGLRKCTEIEEIIVCEDGSVDGSLEEWDNLLDFPNDFIIRSNDLHEIRSTDRAIRLSRAEICCIVQDDDELTEDNSWHHEAMRIFEKYPKLGILGGYLGYHNFFDSHIGRPNGRKRIKAGPQFSFVEHVNIGPFFIRKRFFEEIGGWDFNISQPGEMGLGLDHEICYRMWLNGYQVGHYIPYKYGNDTALLGGTHVLGGRNKQLEFIQEYIPGKYGSDMDEVTKFVKYCNDNR